MFVRSLRLAGFKSFADPTILEFQPGVNVIVGPNGSGKSNIADALSWVLGSQAPASLRGGSMEDVIFAGSEARPRLGVAEVELTLDNSSGVLPLDLAEVTISRFTDRSGLSEYRINGAGCRLLDITELLSDSGVGRSLHTLVGQGQLDQVLQARPEDRRTFIEEAAQIGKYRRRKDRALRKIERVDDNLVRLNDVLSELRRSIRPLKRQAGAASQYSELMNEFVEVKQRLAATEIQRLALHEAELDLEGATQRGELLADELASIRARLGSALEGRTALGHAAEASQDVAHRLGRATDRLAGLGRLAQERAARIRARLAAETEEGYRERILLFERDVRRWSAESEALEEGRAQASERRAAAAALTSQARTALVDAEAALGAARTREIEAAQMLVRAEGAEAAGRATIGSIEARVDSVVERRTVAEHALTQHGTAISSAEREVAELERELDTVTESAAGAEARLEEERMRAEALRGRSNATYAGQAAARARVEALDEVAALFSDRPEIVALLSGLRSEARRALETASLSDEEARRVLKEAEAAIETHWQAVARLDAELRRLDALASGAAERLGGLRRDHDKKEIEIAALSDELARGRDALASAERAAVEERAALPAIQAGRDEARSERERVERVVADARAGEERVMVAANAAEIEARGAEERALGARLRFEEAEAGMADAQRALEGLAELRSSLQAACARAETLSETAAAGAIQGRVWTSHAEEAAAAARRRARASDDALSEMRERERHLEKNLANATTRRNEVAVKGAEMRARAEALGERAMEEWGLSHSDLMNAEPLDEAIEPEAHERMGELERQMKRLGPVNPNAATEYAEVSERETFLVDQIDDLKSSKRDLMKIVHDVDDTIVSVFESAFDDVAHEFESVVGRLFPGGAGKLSLSDPDDLLSSGIEIEARPPGKNVKKLSLLSGGERSLVALAFLFAIFRARPSPFYLLDEVEAALDDINLQRFLGLVGELEERAQILIVTHQKRTMEAADVLYGVSMARDGVSQVVAKKMDRDDSPLDRAIGVDRVVDLSESGTPGVV